MSHRHVTQTISSNALEHLKSIIDEHGNAINSLIEGDLDLHVVATASLPPASAQMDGQVMIEQGVGAVRNLIVYTNGARYRFTGSAF